VSFVGVDRVPNKQPPARGGDDRQFPLRPQNSRRIRRRQLQVRHKQRSEHGCMACGGHVLRKVLLGSAMSDPSMPCWRVTSETALWPFQGWPAHRAGGRLLPLGHPTPMEVNNTLHRQGVDRFREFASKLVVNSSHLPFPNGLS
jgi:hypothetical protein